MTTFVAEPTYLAVMALLDAEPLLTVYPDGAPDRAVAPYVTAWLTIDREDPDRLEGSTNRVWWRLTTHSVASSRTGALRVADLVRRALLDQRPTIDDTVSTRIRHDNARPAPDDESIGTTVLDTVDQWTFQTWPDRD